MYEPKGLRKHHTKSRKGCKTCKQRRVKCDESHPTCRNCIKRDVQCVWIETKQSPADVSPDASPLISSDSGPTTSIAERRRSLQYISPSSSSLSSRHLPSTPIPAHPSNPSGSTAVSPSNGLSLLDMTSLELMQEFVLHTCQSLPCSSAHPERLQKYAPRLALKHPFLMHTLLCLAALDIHVQHTVVGSVPAEKDYSEIAEFHYSMAVTEMLETRTAQSDDGVFDALLMTNSLLGVYVFGRTPTQDSQASPFSAATMNPLDWIPLARGFLKATAYYWAQEMKNQLTELADLSVKITKLRPDLQNSSSFLLFPEELLSFHLPTCGAPDVEEVQDDHTSNVYKQAIARLRESWALSFRPGYGQACIFLWPMDISEEFFGYMMQRRPRALVIMAFYCTFVGQFSDLWWVRNRGASDIKAIADMIDERWLSWLTLPFSMLKSSTGIDSFGFPLS